MGRVPEGDNGFFRALMSYYIHQDWLVWSLLTIRRSYLAQRTRTQTLPAGYSAWPAELLSPSLALGMIPLLGNVCQLEEGRGAGGSLSGKAFRCVAGSIEAPKKGFSVRQLEKIVGPADERNLRLEDPVDIPCTMEYPEYLDTVIGRPVKDEVVLEARNRPRA